MTRAVAVLARLGRIGGTVEPRGDRLRVHAPVPVPGDLLDAVRTAKPDHLRLLDGSRCRFCEAGPLGWRTPGAALAFGDGTSAHAGCWVAHRAALAADPRHASDPAEVTLRGDADE